MRFFKVSTTRKNGYRNPIRSMVQILSYDSVRKKVQYSIKLYYNFSIVQKFDK